jgi:hypothetical protein
MTRERKQLVEFFATSCHPFLGKETKKLDFVLRFDLASVIHPQNTLLEKTD